MLTLREGVFPFQEQHNEVQYVQVFCRSEKMFYETDQDYLVGTICWHHDMVSVSLRGMQLPAFNAVSILFYFFCSSQVRSMLYYLKFFGFAVTKQKEAKKMTLDNWHLIIQSSCSNYHGIPHNSG